LGLLLQVCRFAVAAMGSRCSCPCTYNPLQPAFVAVLLWVILGTFCYWLLGNSSEVPEFDEHGGIVQVRYESWTVAQSFYYSVQAGLSIGYGLLSEGKESSRLFTVFYILAGSSFIVGALVYFIEISLCQQEEWQSEEEKKLAKFSACIKADGYAGFNLGQLHELMICYPEHMRDVVFRLENDYQKVQDTMQEFSESSLSQRARMVDSILKDACSKLEEFENHVVSIPDLLKMHLQEASWRQRAWHFLCAHTTMTRELLATIIWATIGILYVCIAEDASFISGLYFAVTSMSTAGFYAVTSTASGSVYWFTGIYCLIGVPLYAFLLGSYANILVEQYNKEQMLESIHARMKGSEVAFLEHLVKNEHKEKADFADYVEIQLLRLGKVDRDFLRQLRDDFNGLDQDGVGKIPLHAFLSESQRKVVEHEQNEKKSAEAAQSTEVGHAGLAVANQADAGRADDLFDCNEACVEVEV